MFLFVQIITLSDAHVRSHHTPALKHACVLVSVSNRLSHGTKILKFALFFVRLKANCRQPMEHQRHEKARQKAQI